MKIQKIFAAIRKIFDAITYKVIAIAGIIFMIGIIIHYLKSSTSNKLLVIFLAALGLFATFLLFVVNSFKQDKK